MCSSGESDHESGAQAGGGATGAFLIFFFFLLFVRPPRLFSASGSTARASLPRREPRQRTAWRCCAVCLISSKVAPATFSSSWRYRLDDYDQDLKGQTVSRARF